MKILEGLRQRFEEHHQVHFTSGAIRSAVELAKDWRTDKMLRSLEALLVVADPHQTFLISGSGDVIEPDEGIATIGSGGSFALANTAAVTRVPSVMSRRTLRDPIKRTEYLLHLEGVELEEQSKSATEQARATGAVKKQIVPPDLLEEVFELNMQLEELRMNKKVGDDDPALIAEIGKQKLSLESKHEELLQELQACWREWDALVDRGQAASEERTQATSKMIDVLNRRNYIRNLVRDVNAALEE